MLRTIIAPAAVACLLALTACANSGAGWGYDKSRADAEPWSAAHGECLRAAQAVPAQPLRQITARHTYDECLRARGWERDERIGIPHRAYRR
jgi:hypothetical protein